MRVLVVFPIECVVKECTNHSTAILRVLKREWRCDAVAGHAWTSISLETHLVPIDRAIARWASRIGVRVVFESGTKPKRLPTQCRGYMWARALGYTSGVKTLGHLMRGVNKAIVFARSRSPHDPYNVAARSVVARKKRVRHHMLEVSGDGKVVVTLLE